MVAPLVVLAVLLAVAAFALVRQLLTGSQRIEGVTVRTPTDDTRIDPDGAVRSIQGADIVLPDRLFGELWTAETLERLARTYWSFLSHATLGIVRVYYTDRERYVCLLFKPFKLLTFGAPEYEVDAARGIVRWRIEKGLLVASAGRGGDGYLEIDVRRLACDVAGHQRIHVEVEVANFYQRCPYDEPGMGRIHIEVEVANFYPAIASRLGRFLYTNTQSRIHVIVTHGFLRRLARRDLDQSVTGRYRALSRNGR
jgi:hypothetical protein